ncbi:MAG: hypothetical protein KKB25_01535 [Nanoarchaeota archaeon]|nr:hypothetical protein [Nanoarchaeota archaeon]
MTKEEKVYDDFVINFSLTNLSRAEARNKVVNLFLFEKGGYWKDGKKHVTRYKYFVEFLKDGRRIFLLRPTFLNKGIDFQVWVEKFDGENDKKPSHKDIFKDLILKKKENQEKFKKVIEAINEVWNCQEPDVVIKKLGDLTFKNGFSLEMVLKILKWLFIEQDITYWNYDGRAMLRKAIDEETKNV